MEHWLKLTLNSSFIRKMNKQQYKETMHWLRLCCRIVENQVIQEIYYGT